MSKRKGFFDQNLIPIACILLAFVNAACTALPAEPADSLPSATAARPSLQPTAIVLPSLSARLTLSATPAVIAMPVAAICSPISGYSEAELLAAISNPFNPPPPGSDDPHQGIDLAVAQNGMALAGEPVHAVLPGRVAMVVHNRFPYGYAVLIETSLTDLPENALQDDFLPTPGPTLPPHPVMNCPEVPSPVSKEGERSLYLLYAHLADAADVQPGEQVSCGATLGKIGQSGNALNPHLHIEARIGPPGAYIASMAHYDSTASADEMGSYCLWRVSGLFQLVNPVPLLNSLP